MRKSIAAALIAASAASAACSHDRDENPGPVVARAYQVGNFTELEAAGPFNVTVRTGARPSVQAKGNQSLIDKLVVEVDGNTLKIHPEKKNGWFGGWHGLRGKADIVVTVPQLRAASLAGSGGINIDKVQGDSFDGDIAGSGDLSIQSLDVGSLKVSIAGAGSVTGTGKAGSADYDIAGSGDVDAERIVVEDLKVSIAGSGNVRAHATRAAKVDIVGSGDVEVKGGAKCSVSKMGSGDVRCS
ncbi:head GIN domain-containing protein [Sphingomonas sp. URHD0057]|uniref:head GIN domain-containing protein n=1 Tax=Sphingomonas sp. URHD0057 TaxID=1380389 RepID=UPI00048E051C|nr:head GIN domain-containing protein [Sphingomonas sp. URHD0057]